MKENLKQLLLAAGETKLQSLVLTIYGTDEQVDKLIETALLASNTPALANQISKEIRSLNLDDRFIHYNQSYELSRILDQLIEQIESLLADNPKTAFELADQFINTHVSVLGSCDDSDGDIGQCYRDATRLWLAAATAWNNSDQPCNLDWSEEILQRHHNNDYAVWDYLIDNSLPLLGEARLRELALDFENRIKTLAKTSSQGYNPALSGASLGLMGVAQALGDVAMYERSYLLRTPDVNELQKLNIAVFCLQQQDPQSALKWLQGEWNDRNRTERNRLIDQAYAMSGDSEALLEIRRQAYESEPGFEQLQALLQIAPKAERDTIQTQAIARASSADNINVAVDTLIRLNAAKEAANYVLQHSEKTHLVGYSTLSIWAKLFESTQQYLASVLVYRVLLLDILQAGRARAYRHAAGYYTALQRLDRKVVDYQKLPNYESFLQGLKKDHGRKRSFWSLVS